MPSSSKRATSNTPNLDGVRAALSAMIEEGKHEELVALVLQLLGDVRDRNTTLELRLANALRQLYGRKSEKVSAAQLQLMLAMLPTSEAAAANSSDLAPVESAAPAIDPLVPEPKQPPKRAGHGRKPFPASLPRQRITHEPTDAEKVCGECGSAKKRMGYETSAMIEFVPASFRVIENARAKYACAKCQGGVVIGPVGDKVTESGMAGPGLLAHVLTSKYADHLPLHRLAKIYARSGVELSDSTLGGWVAAAADALEPIARRISREVLAAAVLGTDATGMRVLDRDHPKGIKRGTMWVYVSEKAAVFQYTPTGAGKGPESFLANRIGPLQCDGASVFTEATSDDRITRVGCWAHCRRRFVEAMDAGDPNAAVGVALIRQMYDVERHATEEKVDPEERGRRRDIQTRPLTERLGKWIRDVYDRTPPKTLLGKALGYAIRQWPTLVVFLEDGNIPIDNTRVERAIRAVAVGRKNYLFCGSDQGAERAAIIYSVLGTCALHEVDPWQYLHGVFTRLAAGCPQSRLDELLPGAWAEQQRQNAAADAAVPAAG